MKVKELIDCLLLQVEQGGLNTEIEIEGPNGIIHEITYQTEEFRLATKITEGWNFLYVDGKRFSVFLKKIDNVICVMKDNTAYTIEGYKDLIRFQNKEIKNASSKSQS